MRAALRARILEAIARADGEGRDALLRDLARWQAARVAPYGRLVARHAARGVDPLDWPALPTDVFRHVRVAGHAEDEDVAVFRTSGTTSGARGEHAFAELELYDRAAERAARLALFAGLARADLVILAPTPDEAPSSSLSYMLGRFAEWFGRRARWVFPIDERLARALDEAGEAPVALLGTSFAFVHAEDALVARRFAMPQGSFAMQTGGFKGRSRELDAAALRAGIAARYGLPDARVVAEYGMTELSSQLYERFGAPGRLWAPPWVRARVVDPETLAEVPDGSTGLLRLDDPANLDSVAAIQTADLAIRHADGLELLGRAPGAVPRGCSLAVEEALG